MVKIQTLLKPHKPVLRPKLPELPQEILTEIFTLNVKHRFDWRDEILGYALVSKAWYAAARPAYYSQYELYNSKCLTLLEKRLKGDPTITNLVRRIEIEANIATYLLYPVDLRTMPGVQEMSWTNSEPYPIPPQASRGVQKLLGLFPNLRTLHISAVFESIEQLKTFLAYCGPIRGLSLGAGLRFDALEPVSSLSISSDAKEPRPRFAMEHLERLEILGREGSNFDWVYHRLVGELTPKLRSLRIDDGGMSVPVLCLLLEKVSSTLTCLSMDTKRLIDRRGLYYAPRLYRRSNPFPPLPELRFIALGTLTTEYWPMNFLDLICFNFLEYLRAPALHTLQLTIHTSSPRKLVDLLECYDWTSFFAVLIPMFTELQLVLCIIMEVEFGQTWRGKLEALATRYVRWKCPCCADQIKTTVQFSVEKLYPDTLQEPFPENPMSDGESDLDVVH